MLQVNYIRENREKVLERLSIRNFKQPELVDEIIKIDEDRRSSCQTNWRFNAYG
jgi:seryl-tRNA synthetase